VIRILIADDHTLVRDGLKKILAAASDIEVVAEAASGDEALARVKTGELDLALVDMSMPGLSGIALIKRLKLEQPKLRLLVLSMHGEKQYGGRALKAGASGYLTKDSASAQLIGAIRKVAGGGMYVTEAVATQLLTEVASPGDAPPHTTLSDREFEVFRLLVAGKSVTEIAGEIHLSVKTVSTHKTRVLEKMSMANTAELVRYAVAQGLLDPT